MKNRLICLKNKFWFRLFVKIAVIFFVFVLLLTLCNSAFLKEYYEYVNKSDLKNASADLENLDINSKNDVADVITSIEDTYGFETEIYSNNGKTIYSSSGGQLMDYYLQENNKLFMNHRPLKAIESEWFSDGSIMERAIDIVTENEYLVYRFSVDDSYICELRVQMSQIENSAKIANRFISIIAVVFLFISLIWVFAFSKKISEPISRMNEITGNMAALDFSKKLNVSSEDEIGELASSINHLSEKLDVTLQDLNESNAKLRSEIELEHQLDKMRKGFVANVSHELKTPISIIQGYAEGLKADINTAAKEKYIDVIIDESKRMNRLVLNILNLSKYESGQIPLNFSDFNISELIKVRGDRIFNNKAVKIIYDIPDKLTVWADVDQIDQVLKSYMENAESHVNDGGEIKVSAIDNQNGKCIVTVYNSGSKIETEQMPEIWQSFYRGDKSHNRQSGRFGLGLSIVSAIIKMHGESCGVYNTDDGVCFWFTISTEKCDKN